jgi:carboxyl-terminal processing protease
MLKLPRSVRTGLVLAGAVCCLLFTGPIHPSAAQSIGFQRGVGREMLASIKKRIQENYYDPQFRGVDLDAQFKAADELIKKADSTAQISATITAFVLSLNDPHTWYYPPSRVLAYDYGWTMGTIGEDCYVTAVRVGSDAEKQGVRPGDQVLSVMDEAPTRADLWKIQYYMYYISPQRSLRVSVCPPGGQPRQLSLAANVTRPFRAMDNRDLAGIQRQRVEYMSREKRWRHRFHEVGDGTLIWKMPSFDRYKDEVNDLFNRARKFKSLIIDLRGNRGGVDEETLTAIIGNLFDHDIKIGELAGRKGKKPLMAKARSKKPYAGNVILLVSASSEESSELLARLLQLEKRATVIGDRTAGRVMREREFEERMGAEVVLIYGVILAEDDVIMTDGKSLENVGVTPDELLLPSAQDLAAGRDPVLARACALAGTPMDPAQAGALFPYLWPE